MTYYPGFRPAVLGPTIIPIALACSSNIHSSAIFALYSALLALVSLPWILFAAAQRFRPSVVLGPVESPPCILHTFLPLMAGDRHCCLVRLDFALHCLHRMRPPSVRNVLFRGVGDEGRFIFLSTLWVVLTSHCSFAGNRPCFHKVPIETKYIGS